jgi:hypothetical protein
MAINGAENPSFLEYLESRHVPQSYHIRDFLYGHTGPCPQVPRDHPFGQAAEVLNIPPEEWADWRTHVEEYYLLNAAPFGLAATEFSVARFTESGLVGYGPVTDEVFTHTMSEGLYSKFLCPTLDPIDEKRFAAFLTQRDRYQYLKSDYSCMEVIDKPWPHEYVAPTVVLLRRPANNPTSYDYEVVCIALRYWDETAQAFVDLEPPLTPGDGEAWRLAKYFVLQGAAHRINLIDHTKVHFPGDVINAVSKTVLPTRNLLLQLLLPHFWLTLPVNNTVLEGQRSLISRRTWYPWSPFVAKGPQVRRLFPFGWYGARYYSTEPNSAYPPYRFEVEPPALPSRYGAFIVAYREPIRAFVADVLENLPPDDDMHTDWLEIQCWASQIWSWLPGFPPWTSFLARTADERAKALATLTDVVTAVILNAAVIHSADHTTLHAMVDEVPVPFVLRVPPPRSASATLPISARLKAFAAPVKLAAESVVRKVLGDGAEQALEGIENHVGSALAEHMTMLCWPTDLIYARMADLLFYRPHNASLLIDCDYAFKDSPGPLSQAVTKFKAALRQVAATEGPIASTYGFPLLEPPAGLPPDQRDAIAAQKCIGAGIQY